MSLAIKELNVQEPEQRSAMMLHRVRLVLGQQRTQLSNALRAHMAEFVSSRRSSVWAWSNCRDLVDTEDHRLPPDARTCLQVLAAQLTVVKAQMLENDRRIMTDARSTELGPRLMAIPGLDPLLASALVATVADPSIFGRRRSVGRAHEVGKGEQEVMQKAG